jgi:hypothetical protein
LFRSVHITEMQHNQTSCMNERRALNPPIEWINWRKWSCNKTVSADDTPIHDRTKPHKGTKTGQDRNKCWAVSNPSHPVTHNWESWEMMLRCNKLSFVGNRLCYFLKKKNLKYIFTKVTIILLKNLFFRLAKVGTHTELWNSNLNFNEGVQYNNINICRLN